jgi:Cys-tRNA(Pro)/Cys-tRNA(Cys) deacylase
MILLSIDKLQKQTGYIRGGCSPIGMKKSFPIIGDYSILELDQIYINAGIRGLLLTTSQKVLGKVIDIDYNPITQ